MGVCKSKGKTVDSIKKDQSIKFEEGRSPYVESPYVGSSPQIKQTQKVLLPKASRILDIHYLNIPNKFNRVPIQTKDQKDELGGLIGLRNSGNFCFMNAAIQLLSNTEPLTDYFISDLHTSEINPNNPLSSKGQVTQQFASLIKQLWQKARVDDLTMNNENMINQDELVSTMKNWAPQFAMGTQEDSHEFLAFLLDMIHEDLNRVKIKPYIEESHHTGLPNQGQADESWHSYLQRNRSVIVDLFQGQQKSSLKCQTCMYQSHRYEPFMYLSLPVFDQHNTKYSSPFLLEDCIEEYCKEEYLTNEDQWFCPKCEVRRDCVKKIDLWTMPNILVIHLKRFQFTEENKCKLTTFIDFPLSNLNFQKITMGKQIDAPTYDLYGVINHEGSLSRGHYYSYAKHRDDLNWYRFNDSIVTLIPEPEQTVVTKDAYLLFFYKNSVHEFKRQTLTQDLLRVNDNLDNHSKIQSETQFADKRSLKNHMSMKYKPNNSFIVEPQEKSDQNIFPILEEDHIQFDETPSRRQIQFSAVNLNKMLKFKEDEKLKAEEKNQNISKQN